MSLSTDVACQLAMTHTHMKYRGVLLTISFLSGVLAMHLPVDSAITLKAQAKCGGIEGRVTTPQGLLIPDAKVFFFNKDTKKFSSADSNEQGLYEACLPAGVYDVTVEALGFKSAKRKAIQVNHGGRNVIDFPLKHRPDTSRHIYFLRDP